MFHHFHSREHPPNQGSVSEETLDAMLRWLSARYTLIGAREWADRAAEGNLADDHVCLSFDDNLRCQYDVALPVLQAWELTAFWFVYTSVLAGVPERLEMYRHFRSTVFESVDAFYDAFFARAKQDSDVERALEAFDPSGYLVEFPFYTAADRVFRFVRDDLLGPERYHAHMSAMLHDFGFDESDLLHRLWMDERCLQRLHDGGHVIGLHSHSHPTRIAEMSAAAQHEEYARNSEAIKRAVGETPTTMSHPCGNYGPETLDVLRSMGIALGFRSNMARSATSPLEHPREDHANIVAAMA